MVSVVDNGSSFFETIPPSFYAQDQAPGLLTELRWAMPLSITLAHSPDPDDVFMWWPLTGKIDPAGRVLSPPSIDTRGLRFVPWPVDIHDLNQHATSGSPYEVTALSVACWGTALVADRYAVTRCGGSFGKGYGPRLVVQASSPLAHPHDLLTSNGPIAIPGHQTTAFLVLKQLLGLAPHADLSRFVRLPFEQIIPAVARGEFLAGLVIHEGQITYAQQDLRLLVDLGQWWGATTSLPLPLGVNAIRRDLDQTHGPGTFQLVTDLLHQSVEHAMARWDESVAYTLPFAAANAARAGTTPPDLQQVDRYCRMYVTEETRDMGDAGEDAIRRVLSTPSQLPAPIVRRSRT